MSSLHGYRHPPLHAEKSISRRGECVERTASDVEAEAAPHAAQSAEARLQMAPFMKPTALPNSSPTRMRARLGPPARARKTC